MNFLTEVLLIEFSWKTTSPLELNRICYDRCCVAEVNLALSEHLTVSTVDKWHSVNYQNSFCVKDDKLCSASNGPNSESGPIKCTLGPSFLQIV